MYIASVYGLHNYIITHVYGKLFTLSTGLSTENIMQIPCRNLANTRFLRVFKTFSQRVSVKNGYNILFIQYLHEYCQTITKNAGVCCNSCIFIYSASPKMDFVA